MYACARSLREEVEDRQFNVFENWQITWLCLMIWQHLLTSCINIRAIHHFYGFIALGTTTFLSTHGFSCLVSWETASYGYFSRGSTQTRRLYSISDYVIYVSEPFLSATTIWSLRRWFQKLLFCYSSSKVWSNVSSDQNICVFTTLLVRLPSVPFNAVSEWLKVIKHTNAEVFIKIAFVLGSSGIFTIYYWEAAMLSHLLGDSHIQLLDGTDF